MNPGVVPGFSAHDELADLVAAGLTPYQALRAATANAAEFLGAGNQRGTVAEGQNADLVLLDANPLVDIENTRRIAGVVLRGRWLSKAEIGGMLE
jgi:imidazolonepropionase-like amidohydrolase